MAWRKTSLETGYKFSFDQLEAPSGALCPPSPRAEAGQNDPSLAEDWRAPTMAFAAEPGLSGGGVLILREVEKTFCSDPAAEQGGSKQCTD